MALNVRFAPSPTGHLHVGGARTALFNWLLARKEGGRFVLRIEDTDRERSSEEMVRGILESMRWLGLEWDEEPVFQSEGTERHRRDVESLIEAGVAYRDFMDPEELEQIRERDPEDPALLRLPRERAETLGHQEVKRRAAAGEPHAVRFAVPDQGETTWDDGVYDTVTFRNADIEDFVLLRRDGTPTYNLAVVSDDHEAGIDHVIRGDDHLSNTPKQILIYRALDRPVPAFSHLPMILGPDGKRLSKRHGATAVEAYREQGILPQAMVNFLALLGWSPGDGREVMEVDELVEAFSLERVLKKSAVFDHEKLAWLNGEHINRTPPEELAEPVAERIEGAVEGVSRDDLLSDREWFHALVELLKPRSRSLDDFASQARPYVAEPDFEAKAVKKHWAKDPEGAATRLRALRQRLSDAPWEEEALEEALRALAEELEVGAGKLIHPLRVALTGQMVSPGIFEVLVIMGRERSLKRMDDAAARLEAGDLPSED